MQEDDPDELGSPTPTPPPEKPVVRLVKRPRGRRVSIEAIMQDDDPGPAAVSETRGANEESEESEDDVCDEEVELWKVCLRRV